MATKNTVANEPGVIGQMYENRKSKKVGVLESRETKFKTLMMRDAEGKTFNVSYSTFRSDWRKYQGEEVIQTSTQVEEQRAEEQKEVSEAKVEVNKEADIVKPSSEEHVKIVRALRKLADESVKSAEHKLEVNSIHDGGTVVRCHGKKRALFEIWAPTKFPDVVSFRMREDLAKFVETDEPSEYLESAINCIRFRPKKENYESFLKVMITAVDKFVEETDFLKKKNDKNEEKENE